MKISVNGYDNLDDIPIPTQELIKICNQNKKN
jgi:hypothetical protein